MNDLRINKLTRRHAVLGAAALAIDTAISELAYAASTWPAKPVQVIVPYPTGGGADRISRILFGKLSESLGQSFRIRNLSGPGGTHGQRAVAKSNPDGYTLLYDASAFSVNPSLYSNLSFDYAKDFEPVFLAALVPNILVVTPSVPVTSVADIVAMGKNTPRGLNFASSGFGTVQHLSLEMFRLATNTKINHVPYAGGGPALKAVSAGRVKFFFSNAASSIPLVQSGRLKAIAHTGNGRLATLPELPSVKESLAGFEAYDWNGVFVPARTPQSVVERLSTSLDATARDPQVIAQLKALNVETRNNSPSEFRTFVEAERLKWGRLIREANIKQR